MCMVRGRGDILFQALNIGGRGRGQNKLGGAVDFFFDQGGWGALFSEIKGIFSCLTDTHLLSFQTLKGSYGYFCPCQTFLINVIKRLCVVSGGGDILL